jgi:hypothetical protein
MIGTTSRGPGMVISAGGLFSAPMSSDLLPGESSAAIQEHYARRLWIIDRSVKSVVPRSGGQHLSGLHCCEQGGLGVTTQYGEQRQIIHDLGHFQWAVARDLHRSQVGIFLADSCDFFLIAAIGEDLAYELCDIGRHRHPRRDLRRWEKLTSYCGTPLCPRGGILQLGRKCRVQRHHYRIPNVFVETL